MVSLKNFLENLTFKEETPLGNNGVLISGGQNSVFPLQENSIKM